MFRFIHTADWQIGKIFGGLPPEKQGVLREARASAADRIAAVAHDHGADQVLVAGDVFDSDNLPAREVAHLLERLRSHAVVTWHLLPGNHDPDRPGGLYERVVRAGLPGNVRICRSAEATPLAAGVVLLPAPLNAKAQSRDPTAWMDAAETAPGTLRVGLAHGSAASFGVTSEAAARIAPERIQKAGLAYLALGDWHGTKEVAPGVWYSGTPEPDRYLGNESGQVLAVTLGAGRTGVTIKPVVTRRYAWHEVVIEPRTVGDIDQLAAKLAQSSNALDRVLARMNIHGQVPLSAHGPILARLGDLEERLFHLDLDREAFAVTPDGDDLSALGAGSDLTRAAERLIALRADPERQVTAARALEILFRLAAETRR